MLKTAMRGSVRVITLALPEKRNAISRAMCEALLVALDQAASDEATCAVVITGEGGHFCAGGDLDDMIERDVGGWRDHFDHVARLPRRLVGFPKPVVAAVEGWAIGAGLGLANACDMIVAAEDAQLAYGFDKVGVLPDLALIHTLPQRVGVVRARQIMIWGERFAARGALEAGLVDRLAATGQALDLAVELAEQAGAGAPLPIAYLKSFMAEGLERSIAFEKDTASVLFTTADHREGVAAFREKRAPAFVGR